EYTVGRWRVPPRVGRRVPPKLRARRSVRPPPASPANVPEPLPDSVKGPPIVLCVELSEALTHAWDCQVKSRVLACAGRAKMMRTNCKNDGDPFHTWSTPKATDC